MLSRGRCGVFFRRVNIQIVTDFSDVHVDEYICIDENEWDATPCQTCLETCINTIGCFVCRQLIDTEVHVLCGNHAIYPPDNYVLYCDTISTFCKDDDTCDCNPFYNTYHIIGGIGSCEPEFTYFSTNQRGSRE